MIKLVNGFVMDIPSYLSGALFMKAYRLLRIEVATCLRRYNLTPTSWVLLGITKQAKDGIRLSEVATQMSVKAPLVTILAQTLVADGHIQLISHHSDGRAKLLVLTPSGKDFVKKVELSMDALLTDMLKGANESDLNGFKKVLETLVGNSK